MNDGRPRSFLCFESMRGVIRISLQWNVHEVGRLGVLNEVSLLIPNYHNFHNGQVVEVGAQRDGSVGNDA
jgi:hypothetical protein